MAMKSIAELFWPIFFAIKIEIAKTLSCPELRTLAALIV